MNRPDVFTVSFDQNPSMSEAVQGKKAGDRMKLEVHATLKQQTAEGVDFTIEAVVPEGFELDEKQEDASAMASDTNMTPTAMMVKRQRQ